MKRAHTAAVAALVATVVALSAAPAQATLAEDVRQATTILERFKDMPEEGIPRAVLRDAKGLAILTVLKAGFVFSGEGGTGLVIARLGKSSWSGPSAIATGGAGFGFQIGASVTEFVMVLNTDDAVKAFSHGGNIKLGADVSVAAGPVGRDIAAGVMPVAAVYSYSRSQGLFAGVSLEGTVIVTRDDANEEYYGRKVTADEILSGKVRPPKSAHELIRTLESF
ncbi:MAG TPA: YSC84-related protein [Candidatus Binatia bacterium]